jgi:hypothetical protein
MFPKGISVVVLISAGVISGLVGVAQQSPTEAPTGFDTPTLAQNAGSQSISNGIAQPLANRYALDQARFEQNHDAGAGLGRFLMLECAGIVTRIL